MSKHFNRVLSLIERDGRSNCHYCGTPLSLETAAYRDDGVSLDHVIPVSKGGSDTLDNLVLACRKCNGKKHTKHYQEFRLTNEIDGVILFLMGGET